MNMNKRSARIAGILYILGTAAGVMSVLFLGTMNIWQWGMWYSGGHWRA